jgi:eukaryotic translation initiation factor 2C
VIKDDIGFEADQLDEFTHKLCYTFNRATKAVSICPPAYYADLLCERGRAYLFSLLAENTSRLETSTDGTDDSQIDLNALEWRGGVHADLRNSTWYV